MGDVFGSGCDDLRSFIVSGTDRYAHTKSMDDDADSYPYPHRVRIPDEDENPKPDADSIEHQDSIENYDPDCYVHTDTDEYLSDDLRDYREWR